jgi:hypothetical protein
LGVIVIADLDTLLTALYVELTDRIIPCRGFGRTGPRKPPEVTDAGLVCLAVAQVLLRYDDERHWLRAAPKQVGHLFPRLAPATATTSDDANEITSCGWRRGGVGEDGHLVIIWV